MIRSLPAAATFLAAAVFCTPSPVASQDLCVGYGPQTPRDISSPAGANTRLFTFAPAASRMNLCNLHTHTNAEHKGPGFAISAGSGKYGGWKCNETGDLTEAELAVPDGDAAYEGVKPGDTIEVHWVYSSCDVTPGKGLGSCLSDACANPQLRVEAQVFLVVNDPNALDFGDFAYAGNVVGGLHQAKSLPTGAGDPVTFLAPRASARPSRPPGACDRPAQSSTSTRSTDGRRTATSLRRNTRTASASSTPRRSSWPR